MRAKSFDEVICQVTTRFALRYENNFAPIVQHSRHERITTIYCASPPRINLRLSTSDFQDFFRLTTIYIDLYSSQQTAYIIFHLLRGSLPSFAFSNRVHDLSLSRSVSPLDTGYKIIYVLSVYTRCFV